VSLTEYTREVFLYQRSQEAGDDVRGDPDAHQAYVVAIARVMRGDLGIEEVQESRKSVSSAVVKRRLAARWARKRNTIRAVDVRVMLRRDVVGGIIAALSATGTYSEG